MLLAREIMGANEKALPGAERAMAVVNVQGQRKRQGLKREGSSSSSASTSSASGGAVVDRMDITSIVDTEGIVGVPLRTVAGKRSREVDDADVQRCEDDYEEEEDGRVDLDVIAGRMTLEDLMCGQVKRNGVAPKRRRVAPGAQQLIRRDSVQALIEAASAAGLVGLPTPLPSPQDAIVGTSPGEVEATMGFTAPAVRTQKTAAASRVSIAALCGMDDSVQERTLIKGDLVAEAAAVVKPKRKKVHCVLDVNHVFSAPSTAAPVAAKAHAVIATYKSSKSSHKKHSRDRAPTSSSATGSSPLTELPSTSSTPSRHDPNDTDWSPAKPRFTRNPSEPIAFDALPPLPTKPSKFKKHHHTSSPSTGPVPAPASTRPTSHTPKTRAPPTKHAKPLPSFLGGGPLILHPTLNLFLRVPMHPLFAVPHTSTIPEVVWRGAPLTITATASRVGDLCAEERTVCETLRMMPAQYLEVKECLLANVVVRGPFKKRDAQGWFRIDVNKTNKLYDWFFAVGWIKAATVEWERRERVRAQGGDEALLAEVANDVVREPFKRPAFLGEKVEGEHFG
ncbi:Transcriptional adapter ada2, partial [Irineochytrium annulatum]